MAGRIRIFQIMREPPWQTCDGTFSRFRQGIGIWSCSYQWFMVGPDTEKERYRIRFGIVPGIYRACISTGLPVRVTPYYFLCEDRRAVHPFLATFPYAGMIQALAGRFLFTTLHAFPPLARISHTGS